MRKRIQIEEGAQSSTGACRSDRGNAAQQVLCIATVAIFNHALRLDWMAVRHTNRRMVKWRLAHSDAIVRQRQQEGHQIFLLRLNQPKRRNAEVKIVAIGVTVIATTIIKIDDLHERRLAAI